MGKNRKKTMRPTWAESRDPEFGYHGPSHEIPLSLSKPQEHAADRWYGVPSWSRPTLELHMHQRTGAVSPIIELGGEMLTLAEAVELDVYLHGMVKDARKSLERRAKAERPKAT